MRNSTLYIAALVLGHHPLRGYVALGVGVILLIIGVAGMVMARGRAAGGDNMSSPR